MMGVAQNVKLKKALYEVEDLYQEKIHAVNVSVKDNLQMITKKTALSNVEMA